MSGILIKAGIGAFFVLAASQMTDLAGELLSRARLSVQASELVTLDNHLSVWAIEGRRTRAPQDQGEFQKVCRQLFTTRGERDVAKDRWGQPYSYVLIKERPPSWRVSSSGPDQVLGTKDDLVLERQGDAVWMNRDPAEIAEAAAEYKKARDQEFLKELRRRVRQVRAANEKPLLEQGPAADAASQRKQKKQLEQSLRDLDSLLG